MVSRREFLAASVALGAIAGLGMEGRWSRAAAQQALKEDDLLGAGSFGNVTLLHITDIHAQLKPVYFREPSINIGVGDVKGLPPHVTGADFLKLYNIKPGSPHAYALTSEDFSALAKTYGRMGGLDRVATIVKRVRGERGDNVLLLDGGDTWQGSYTANATKGADMVEVMNALKPDGTGAAVLVGDPLQFQLMFSDIANAEAFDFVDDPGMVVSQRRPLRQARRDQPARHEQHASAEPVPLQGIHPCRHGISPPRCRSTY
jgi:hypothetical protein